MVISQSKIWGKTAKYRLKEFLRNFPIFFSFLRMLMDYRYKFSRFLDYFSAKIECLIGPDPKIQPLKLYQVNPDEIKYALESEIKSDWLSPVVPGDWDRNYGSFRNYDIIYSFNNHFNEGTSWEETDFYERAELNIKDPEKEWVGRISPDSFDEFESYLQRVDKLHGEIKDKGFKKQSELGRDRRGVHDSKAYERHEITVCIGREGDFLLESGWHRLSISKSLDLDKVPVRISTRHKKWQEIRRKTKEDCDPPIEGHPDLMELD